MHPFIRDLYQYAMLPLYMSGEMKRGGRPSWRGNITKGAWGGRLLKVYGRRDSDGALMQLHATKGWRKVPGGAEH